MQKIIVISLFIFTQYTFAAGSERITCDNYPNNPACGVIIPIPSLGERLDNIESKMSQFTLIGSFAFSNLGDTIPKPDCTAAGLNGDPKIVLRMHGIQTTTHSTGLTNVVVSLNAIDSGSEWTIQGSSELSVATGIATTYCYYDS